MTFRRLKEQARVSVERAIESLGITCTRSFEPVEPPNRQHGDLSVPVGLALAKQTGEGPGSVVQKVAARIDLSNADLIASSEAHPAGYLNFRANYTNLFYESLQGALSEDSYGKVDVGHQATILLEHTAVNPNKALHVGHLRNVVLGDSISRILSFTGHDVKVLNYVDDSGLQVADIIVGFQYGGFSKDPSSGQKFDQYCGDTVYVQVNRRYEENEELRLIQRRVLKEMEDHNSSTAHFAAEITEKILVDQLKTCWRVGARYDCLAFESKVLASHLWEEMFTLLRDKGIITFADAGEYKGCWIVTVPGETEGAEKVLVRSDSTVTYIAKDLSFAAWKLGILRDPFGYRVFSQQPDATPLWMTLVEGQVEPHPAIAGASKGITVIDNRQARLQRIISHVLSLLDGERVKDRYLHLGYGVVALSRATAEHLGMHIENNSQVVQMSGRKGIQINADSVLGALHEKAYNETFERNSSESSEWLNETAEKIAVAAIRFEMLNQNLNKMIVFDLNKTLALQGETGPYLLYSLARASHIMSKADFAPKVSREGCATLVDEAEQELAIRISQLDLIIESAARDLGPDIVARYCYRLSDLFNRFYEKNPVLRAEDPLRRESRLALVHAYQRTLKTCLSLLGIPITERI